jgi:peptide/nickel transport system substrate-binding protein
MRSFRDGLSRKSLSALLLVSVTLVGGCANSTPEPSGSINFAPKSHPVDADANCELGADGAPVSGIQRISSTDEHTVTFKLCKPDSAFLSKLALYKFSIDDSGHLSRFSASGEIGRAPNGTGPYFFEAWQDGSQIVLRRNESYWGAKAQAQSLVFEFQNDSSASLLRLQAGTADGMASVGSNDVATIQGNSELHLLTRQPLAMSFIAMTNKSVPFDDLRVRKAVALALDRQRLVDLFYGSSATTAHSYTPCAILYGCEGDSWYEQDLTLARQLLTEAGYPDGFATTMIVRSDATSATPYPLEMAQDIQAQLLNIGITTTIEVLENTVWRTRMSSGENVGLGIGAGWVADYPDVSNYLDFYFRIGGGGSSRLGNPDQELSDTLAQAAAEVDAEKRAALYALANNRIKDLVPMIPIVQTGSSIAIRADVIGGSASPLEIENLAAFKPAGREQLVWLLQTEPSTLYCVGAASQDPLRACAQISEPLYGFSEGTTELEPRLAKECNVSSTGLVWTCTLRNGVRFHDGSKFDATDVVDSFAVQWDCAHPWRNPKLTYNYFAFFSNFLNEEACATQ